MDDSNKCAGNEKRMKNTDNSIGKVSHRENNTTWTLTYYVYQEKEMPLFFYFCIQGSTKKVDSVQTRHCSAVHYAHDDSPPASKKHHQR
eukprot:807923-Ditylum_brightwellii.AAC.1